MPAISTNDLKNGTSLAIALTGLIAAYWVGKVFTQFAYYPMYQVPPGALFKWGGYGMNVLFCFFAVLYVALVLSNIQAYMQG